MASSIEDGELDRLGALVRQARARRGATLDRAPLLTSVRDELVVDTLTPLVIYDRLRGLATRSFLLESVEGGERWARHSFFGLGTVAELRATIDRAEVHVGEGLVVTARCGPGETSAHVLARLLAALPIEVEDPAEERLLGGAVGYVAYDAVRAFEPRLGGVDAERVLFRFVVPEVLLRFDLLSQGLRVSASIDLSDALDGDGLDAARVHEAFAAARRRLDAVREAIFDPSRDRLAHPLPAAAVRGRREPTTRVPEGVETTLDREGFMAAVDRCKDYIRAGDIIQAVISQRLRAPWRADNAHAGDVLALYRHLRLLNPSPYLFLVDLGDEQLVGASPEVLVRKTDRRIEVRPIAGTRRRGRTEAEDRALAAELLADPKERAEHIMLVDLGRNDLGRVSAIGTVQVAEQMVIERYSHVMHIVSHVVGTLRDGLGWADTLAAAFPAGTLSGAPKVRAMEIIDELEPEGRGVYGGAVGYVDFAGNMDLCIAIRTVHVHDGYVDVQAGAGIVADSDPASEWQETLSKASALVAALKL